MYEFFTSEALTVFYSYTHANVANIAWQTAPIGINSLSRKT